MWDVAARMWIGIWAIWRPKERRTAGIRLNYRMNECIQTGSMLKRLFRAQRLAVFRCRLSQVTWVHHARTDLSHSTTYWQPSDAAVCRYWPTQLLPLDKKQRFKVYAIFSFILMMIHAIWIFGFCENVPEGFFLQRNRRESSNNSTEHLIVIHAGVFVRSQD